MRVLSLILSSLCLLTVGTVHGSNYGYRPYHYPVYYPPAQVYNNTYNNYIPYAVPLFSSGYVAPTTVISGAVAYQQTITAVTSATAGAQTTVQTVQGAQVGLQAQAQQQAQTVKELPHVAVMRQHCAKCHTGALARGKFQIFDDAKQYVLGREDIGTVMFRLSTTKVDEQSKQPLRMPPPPDKLAPEDRDAIIEGLVTQPEKAIEPKKEEPK